MKTILITGSTDGIGKLAAAKLAADGHEVILHGRNPNKLESTLTEIKDQTSNKNISAVIADFSSLSSIGSMIDKLSNEVSAIDVLINNAGVFKSNIQTNEEGLELRFMVNYIAPYVLTNGLLPKLQLSDSPRVLNLSSAAQATVSTKALKGSESLSTQSAYAQSKLALTMWSFAFAKDQPEITTIAVNPGSLLNTKMVQEAYGKYWSSAEKGANIIYDLATSKKFSDSNGAYFDNDKGAFSKAHDDAYDQEKIASLDSETKKLLST